MFYSRRQEEIPLTILQEIAIVSDIPSEKVKVRFTLFGRYAEQLKTSDSVWSEQKSESLPGNRRFRRLKT